MKTFVDAIPICEQGGHDWHLDTPWTTCAYGLYVMFHSCKNCDKLLRFKHYKWMGITEDIIWSHLVIVNVHVILLALIQYMLLLVVMRVERKRMVFVMTNHYWKSKWDDNGQFICKVCGKTPINCKGKIRIGWNTMS